MTPEAALAELRAAGNAEDAAGSAAYHKSKREHLGVRNPVVDEMTKRWRAEIGLDLETRLALAKGLWDSDIHEARVAAAKLLTQARIKGDEPVWRLICDWVPQFDAWAIADHAAGAGARRISADFSRLDEVEGWTTHENFWVRRAALVFTLPFAKPRHPKPEELRARERILGWAAGYVVDREWFIQKAIAWWLRDLSKRDPGRVAAFMEVHGPEMKAFARKEACKYL
ncbi:MAG: DNA alkylation repair protein [Pseudomonadota bacterium]